MGTETQPFVIRPNYVKSKNGLSFRTNNNTRLDDAQSLHWMRKYSYVVRTHPPGQSKLFCINLCVVCARPRRQSGAPHRIFGTETIFLWRPFSWTPFRCGCASSRSPFFAFANRANGVHSVARPQLYPVHSSHTHTWSVGRSVIPSFYVY